MSELTQHEKDLMAIAEFRMFDDTFMSAVFDGQINETELLLRVVLGREDIQVKSCEAQFYISNIYGREARLDILARDQSVKHTMSKCRESFQVLLYSAPGLTAQWVM